MIRPSGYFNQNAERLKIAADFFLKKKIGCKIKPSLFIIIKLINIFNINEIKGFFSAYKNN